MLKGLTLVSALILAAGCGAPAIVDATRQIAELRSCEPAELTVSGAPDALTVDGCGEPAVYACSGGACRASEATPAPDAERVAQVTQQLAGIAAGVGSCAEGAETPTVQVYIGSDGKPNGLALHPDLGSDVRACIGHLVLEAVEAPGGAELLVSYRPGAPPPEEEEEAVLSPVSETMETIEETIDDTPPEETEADPDGVDPDADPEADDVPSSEEAPEEESVL